MKTKLLTMTLFILMSMYSIKSIAQCGVDAYLGYTVTGGSPESFQFIDSSFYTNGWGPIQYVWDFGDASIDTIQNPAHVYASPGTYTVCLKVWASPGTPNYCMDSFCTQITIPAPACNLQASFTYQTNPNNVVVLNATQIGGNGTILYQWLVNGQLMPSNPTPNTSYTDTLPNGSNQVCVYATDTNQCIDTTCQNVIINNNPCSNLSVFVDRRAGPNGWDSIKAVISGGVAPYMYLWSNNSMNISFVDTVSNLCVTVQDNNGCAATACDSVSATGCQAYFTYNMTCDSIFLNNSSTGNYTTTQWQISSPIILTPIVIDNVQNVVLSVQPGMVATVQLIISGGNCQDSYAQTITIPQCPQNGTDTICGYAFTDQNGNGVFDAGDSIISNQDVYIYGGGLQLTTFTDGNGFYQFIVPSGTYNIVSGGPGSGFVPTVPLSSTPNTNTNTNNGYFSVVITGGGRHCGFDFGYRNQRVTISGTVYFDANNNGTQDVGEAGVPYVGVHIGPYYFYTNSIGYYVAQVPVGTYTVSYTASGSYIGYTVAPPSYSVAATTLGNTYSGNDFALYAVPGQCNAKVILIPQTTVTPGFPAWYEVYVYNIGTTNISGTLNLVHDVNVVFNNSSPNQTSFTSNLVRWTVGSIAPGQNANFFVALDASPNIQLGQQFLTLAYFSPSCNDVNMNDNQDTTHQTAVGSWDPNNKLVSPVGVGANGRIKGDETLTYTINFQNTGTAPAVNVVLIDTLSNKVDLSTLQVLASSHDYVLSLDNLGILNCRYSNIMLPDSNTNEPESHGYLMYSVKLLPGLAEGTEIENTAHIYFDFNEAVVTNTTLNTIDYSVSVNDLNTEHATILLYPNPFKDYAMVEITGIGNEPLEIAIFDISGRKVLHESAMNNKFKIDRNSLNSGIYVYEITQGNTKLGSGKLIAE